MEVEETTELADEISIPAESESEGELQNLPSETGADDVQKPEPDANAKTDFGSLFSQAREKAATRQADEDSQESAEEESDSDEKIPEEETKTEETEEEKSAGEPKEDKPPEEKEPKKTSRSETFKQMERERDAAVSENTEIKSRISKLDEQFEKHGGVEVVETALELFELAADKSRASEFVEKINSLPHKAAIQREIFDKVLDLPNNRVYGINRVLTEDFGLTNNLSQPVLEKLFEFATSRLNADVDEFEQYLDRELELIGQNEKSEVEKLREEIEQLKQGSPKEQKEQSAQESEQEFASRIQKTYNNFEDTAFAEVSDKELEKYGFKEIATDTPEVKKAKAYLANALKFAVAVEMREAKAHEQLLDYWIEKTPEENKFYGQARKSYKNAMTIKVQNALAAIAPLLGAAKKADKTKPPGQTLTETAVKNAGQSQLPLPKKEETKPQGFSAAFSAARKRVPQS